ncbi:hypothetical protein IDM36_13120 [Enterobacter mori]|uniref:Uncharacterized protein n=2 Tax=Enterobacter TaxID=547 RepID=A0A7T0GYU2_9ENTR|nr:hypothetical protein [Enterobacter mori]QPJ98881.1 hypothetical protein IDM36_13120 [Enterobacter mori]
MGEISVKTGNNARNGGKNSLNRLIRCVCGKKIGPDPRNFNQRVSLGRNDLLIRTFPNASAQQAKIDATAAAADAAASAQSVDPDNQLKKAQNLADLPDKATSRGNLSVYSIAEINSKLGYALVDFGTVGVNARYVQANPFGNSTPVICQVEIYFNGKWGAPGWVGWYENSIMNTYGLRGGMVLGEGLVVQTARSYLEAPSNNVGSLLGIPSGVSTTSVPCRMHVWKLVP